MIKIKNQHELQITIAEHYKNNEISDIILKTSLALEMALTLGMPSLKLTLKMTDLGVKPNELGLAMAMAFKKTEDKFLSPIDLQIKNAVLDNHSKMIAELEDLLQ